MRLGLIVGKFAPPTLGHKYLIEFARAMTDELVVVVGTDLAGSEIAIPRRVDWLRRHFGDRIGVWSVDLPQLAGMTDLAAYAVQWRDQVLSCLGGRKPDAIFASEAYGRMMAAMLGCAFVEVDVNRQVVPISATDIRHDPVRHWHLLLPEVRTDIMRTFSCICDDDTRRLALASEVRKRLGITVVEQALSGPTEADWPEQVDRLRAAHYAASSIARGSVLLCISAEIAAQVPELLGTTFRTYWNEGEDHGEIEMTKGDGVLLTSLTTQSALIDHVVEEIGRRMRLEKPEVPAGE